MFQSIEDNAKVDDAAIEKYYNDHKAEYDVVKARHILVHVKGAPGPAPNGKPELSDAEALDKAKAIRDRLVKGRRFRHAGQRRIRRFERLAGWIAR